MKSEYIVDTFGIVQEFADLHGDMTMPLYEAIMDVILLRQREEIVRCRDCCHNARGICKVFDYCDIPNLDNGFCAWGERKTNERS